MPILTAELIDTLPPATNIQAFYWDTRLAGFGIKVMESGKKKFIVQYRAQTGKSRRMVLGDYEVLSVCDARHLATEILREVALGKDPADEKKALREAETMADMCIQYMEKHAKVKKKLSSIRHDKMMIHRFILPEFGTRKVTDINRSDINKLHYEMRDTPTQANHVIQLLSKMFNLAEKWGWRPDFSNPVRHVEQYPARKYERCLNMQELARLSNHFAYLEMAGKIPLQVLCAYKLLILTGCRLGEIQTLKWSYVDFDQRCLRLPDSKTGPKNIQIGTPALDLLRTMPRLHDNPYVIFGTLPGNYWTDLQKSWQRIRKEVGLDDVRIHDLRHTFASVAVSMGESMPMIAKLLGHTQLQTTERYAHMAVTPQLEAADRIATTIADMMDSTKLLPAPQILSQQI